jgi:hypothetical protein
MQNNMESSFKEDQSCDKRMGMYKNFRVGIVKAFDKSDTEIPVVTIEVFESCNGVDGPYIATYNLSIEVDPKFSVSNEDVGKWALVGFYMQGFKVAKGRSYISLKLRHFETFDQFGEVVGLTIKDTRTPDGTRLVFIPSAALETSREISDSCTFNKSLK